MTNRMLRFTITFLTLFFTAGSVNAGGETVPGVNEATLYLQTKTISHTQHGETKANNHLRIRTGHVKKIFFSLTTIANEYHECLLEGEATRIDERQYEYRENKCRVIFVLSSDDVTLHATGAHGDYCRADDLSAGHGCGYNTTIDSATYKKVRKPAQSRIH